MQEPKYNLSISSAGELLLCSNNITEDKLLIKMSEVFKQFYYGFLSLWEIMKSENNGEIIKLLCDCDILEENGEITIVTVTISKV